MPSAPLAVSSQSRKRLKTSSHDDKKQAMEEDKENNPCLPEEDHDDEQHDEVVAVAEPCFPQTPAVRIPLEDLIGNTEDAFNCPAPVATPADHVIWHNGPASSDPSASVQGTQKSRKRARSSSPASSQLEKSTHFEGPRDAMDLNGIQKSLRTPNNDPTQELWNRYMRGNLARQGNGESAIGSFAHLPPSSPQTPSTTSKDSGFRRTVSCGIEWPTSKPKRRKIDAGDSHSRTKDIFAASRREILAQNVPKTSRVGLLVEKIQESMNKRQRANDEPSSSSPLPGRHSQLPATQTSPTRSPSKIARGPIHHENAGNTTQLGNQHNQSPLKEIVRSFSDFGDDDLDVDFFEDVELNMSQDHAAETKPNAAQPNSEGPNDSRLHMPDVQRQSTEKPREESSARAETIPAQQPFDKDFDDSFDDDDDTFAEEMQELADKVDSQNELGKISTFDGPAPMPPILEAVHEINDVDDAFDDDDDLWAQVADETAQGKAVIGSTSHVRSIR